MRIFVTGGSGFVGGHVIEKLAGAHTVLAMARSARSAEVVRGFGAEPVECALDTLAAEHLAGVDAVVHAAAYVEEWGTRAQFIAGNVEGTARALAAAREAGASRFIHIGTEAALFDGHDLINIDETYPYPARQKYLYSETKAEAERRVLAANAPGFTTISLRPRFIWGPRDASVLPTIVEMTEKGRFAWLGGGVALTSTVHVHNVVHAVELALTRGEGGQAYFIADAERGTLREFLTQMAAATGVALPDKSMPAGLARAAAAVSEAIWRLFRLGGKPPITRFAAAMLSSTITVRTDKAARELGYQPVIDWAGGFESIK
ncbi:MAG: NAD-dependent epimerase/dehydratase family protein [Myxococcales bacterium]|nr:NAD-dependent epimerase/dehydratase family protein [Myxococcales bacterium]